MSTAHARVLLVPYRVDNRPRVVAEAQSNGIPVPASALPAHREAGTRGVLVPGDASIRAWGDAGVDLGRARSLRAVPFSRR